MVVKSTIYGELTTQKLSIYFVINEIELHMIKSKRFPEYKGLSFLYENWFQIM